jgi:hypothetical protein
MFGLRRVRAKWGSIHGITGILAYFLGVMTRKKVIGQNGRPARDTLKLSPKRLTALLKRAPSISLALGKPDLSKVGMSLTRALGSHVAEISL